MAVVDLVFAIALIVVIVVMALIIARQRQMLRSVGSIPLATRRGNRWLYGVGRYDGDELRFYRAIGIGTRPSRVLHRSELAVLAQRPPTAPEYSSLPRSAVIVECRDSDGEVSLALADGAYEGFVSWLEASSPRD
jgi:Protein of unknown function (DUF2550)